MKRKIVPYQGEQLKIETKPQKRRSSDWVTTGEACEVLGIGHKHLWKLRDEGLLKQGKHWRNIARPHAARPTYRWHLKRCEAALEIKPEVRG